MCVLCVCVSECIFVLKGTKINEKENILQLQRTKPEIVARSSFIRVSKALYTNTHTQLFHVCLALNKYSKNSFVVVDFGTTGLRNLIEIYLYVISVYSIFLLLLRYNKNLNFMNDKNIYIHKSDSF